MQNPRGYAETEKGKIQNTENKILLCNIAYKNLRRNKTFYS